MATSSRQVQDIKYYNGSTWVSVKDGATDLSPKVKIRDASGGWVPAYKAAVATADGSNTVFNRTEMLIFDRTTKAYSVGGDNRFEITYYSGSLDDVELLIPFTTSSYFIIYREGQYIIFERFAVARMVVFFTVSYGNFSVALSISR